MGKGDLELMNEPPLLVVALSSIYSREIKRAFITATQSQLYPLSEVIVVKPPISLASTRNAP